MKARLLTALCLLASASAWVLLPTRPASGGSIGYGTPVSSGVTVSSSYVSGGYASAPVYEQKVVAAPVAVPVVVPAAVFQYLPAVGVAPVAAVAQAAASVSHAAPVQVQAAPMAQVVGHCPPGYAVASASASYASAGASADLDRLLVARLDTLLAARLGASLGVGAAPAPAAASASRLPVAQSPPGTQYPSPAPLPGAGQPPQGASPPADTSSVIGVLTARCASCHTGAASKGGFQIFAAPGTLASLSRSQRSLLTLLSDAGKMPPAAGGDPKSAAALSDQEIGLLKSWSLAD